jgi:hypothetical protein
VRLPTRILVIALALGILTSCSIVRLGGPYPEACSQFDFSARRCSAIVARGLSEANLVRSDVTRIDLLPIPDQPAHFGQGTVAILRFHISTGGNVVQPIVCVGVSEAFDPACGEDARVVFSVGIDHDTPCSGPPPSGCLTLPPTPPPDAMLAARALRVAAIDVPIDHSGHYEIKLGTPTLPNGYLSERRLRLVDDRPATFWVTNSVLSVRSDVDGRPPVGNIYRAPFAGLEPVSVFLVFDVIEFESPGLLQIRDIFVS